MIVTIDGPAGCGKSTIAKILADRLQLFFLNTGNFYRAVSVALLETFGETFSPAPENVNAVIKRTRVLKLAYEADAFFVNSTDVSSKLRSDSVEKIVAQVSAIPELRAIVNEKIRAASAGKNIIC